MADHAARTLRPQDEISHYRIVGPLGAGGMGEVYLAQDRSLDRNVALKILPPELVRSEERVRRFVLEARSASSLSHPNIVTIYEIGQDAVRSSGEADSSAVHFISMELVSGKTLSALIHEDRTELRTLLGYLAQAADGLAKAHAAGIVHRDLKPGNIMVTADGFAKVLDFGLAKLTERRDAGPDASTAETLVADATGEGIVVGTVGYMSPEQVQGKAVDHRSDIFSFGCILYEAATRQRPFAAGTAVETMHRILHDKPTPVEEIDGKAPAELRRLIRRCLAKNADQRLQSMKDVALELREIVDEYETLSAAASSGSGAAGLPVAGAPRRTAVVMWAAAAVVLGSLAVAWWALRHGPQQRQPFQDMRVTAQTDRGDIRECAISPDGRYLAYLFGTTGRTGLHVRQIATGSDVEVLPTTDAELRSPSFSPDGDYLFYAAPRPDKPNYHSLYQVPSLGGTPRLRAFDVDSRVSFSPDGHRIAFWRGVSEPRESRLVILDLDSGKERILAAVSGGVVFHDGPAWSPDGRRIAGILEVPGAEIGTDIVMFDVADGRRRDFLRIPRVMLASIAWLPDGHGLVSSGADLRSTLQDQVFLHSYPQGRTSRVTNDFNVYEGVSTSRADGTIAAARTILITNLWLADVSGAPARRLTSFSDPERSPFNPAAVDSGTIVFDAPMDRNVQLWVIGTTPGAPRPITVTEAHSLNPRSAGGVVVFDRIDSTGMHVWRMIPDGSGPRQLTSGGEERAMSLSRDGRMVLARRSTSPQALTVISTEDGHAIWADTTAMGTLGLSPDGGSVLVGRLLKDTQGLSTTVWDAHPVAGGPPTSTVRLPARAAQFRWAPDSRGVTYLDRSDPAWNVFRQPLVVGPAVQVTNVTRGRVTGYDWSPDGRRLALCVRAGEATDLWITEADGSHPLQLTRFTSEAIFDFTWMPDGRRLVVNAGTPATDAVLIRGTR